MVRSRRALAFAALGLLGASTKLSGCLSGLDLEGRPCPCAPGYQCCEQINICLGPEDTCPDLGGDAGSSSLTIGEGGVPAEGGTGAGGVPASSGGTNEPGSAGQAGMPSEPLAGAAGAESGEPQWRPVGDDDGIAPAPTYDPNLVLAPDGTPYVAYRACEPCQPIDKRKDIPVVLRLDSTWQRLPLVSADATTKASPSLVIGLDGVPNMLLDYQRQLMRFEDDAWSPTGPELPLTVHLPSSLEMDSDGRFYTLLNDEDSLKLAVARLDNLSTYTLLGTSVQGDNGTARLCVVGMQVYRAYVRHDLVEPSANVYVDHFDGNDWQPLGTFVGRGIEMAASLNGDVYVAVEDYELRTARIFKHTGGAWSAQPLQTLAASWHAPMLQVSDAGALYLAYLVEDFPNVNVIAGDDWDDLQSRTLLNGSGVPVIRLRQTGAGVVPILVYLSGGELIARKYQ